MIWIVLTIIFVANLFLWWQFPKPLKLQADVLYDTCLVLGCPTRDDGHLSRMQKSRMDVAIQLYQTHQVKTLILTGANVRNDFIEAEVMAAYAIAQGVKNADIILETKAVNTFDNFRFTARLCEQHHVHNIVVVTSQFHLRRSNFFVRKFFTKYAMQGSHDKEKIKHYLVEYLRMWNTLYWELKFKKRSSR